MNNKIYTIEEIKNITTPIFKQYDIKEVYLFGSYARSEATAFSDIDILLGDNNIHSLFKINGLCNLLAEALNKEIDLVEIDSIKENTKLLKEKYEQTQDKYDFMRYKSNVNFFNQVNKERVLIYE